MKTTLQKGLELLCGLFDVFPFLYNFKRLWNTFKEVVLRSGYYHGITLRCLTCFVYTLHHYLIFLHAFFSNLQCVAERKEINWRALSRNFWLADGQICSSPDVCRYRNTKSLDVMVLMHAGTVRYSIKILS